MGRYIKKITDATSEYDRLYDSVRKIDSLLHYPGILDLVNSIKNPMNQRDKYLMKYKYAIKYEKFEDAIDAIDSFKLYSYMTDTAVTNHTTDLIKMIRATSDYKSAVANQTFYYSLDSLYQQLLDLITSRKLPIDFLENGHFKFKPENNTDPEVVVYERVLKKSIDSKPLIEMVSFQKYALKNLDTVCKIKLRFIDNSTYNTYKDNVSNWNYPVLTAQKSLFKRNPDDDGLEYIVNPYVIFGIMRNDKNTFPFEMYYYSLIRGNKVLDVGNFLQHK